VQALSTVRFAVGIPDEDLFTASAPATTGQARPIRAPRHAHDHTTMPLQPGELCLLRFGFSITETSDTLETSDTSETTETMETMETMETSVVHKGTLSGGLGPCQGGR
jgi:hypothetical protein